MIINVLFPITGFRNDMYFKLLSSLKGLLSKEEYNISNKDKSNVLRINIQSLGSPIWTSQDCEEEDDHQFGQDLLKFVYCLRVLLRGTTAVAFITIPTHLFDVSTDKTK